MKYTWTNNENHVVKNHWSWNNPRWMVWFMSLYQKKFIRILEKTFRSIKFIEVIKNGRFICYTVLPHNPPNYRIYKRHTHMFWNNGQENTLYYLRRTLIFCRRTPTLRGTAICFRRLIETQLFKWHSIKFFLSNN